MKKLFNLILPFALLAGSLFGQALNKTTLSAAVAIADDTITLTATTGIVEQNSFRQAQSWVFADNELFEVVSFVPPGSTTSTKVAVRRGAGPTRITAHNSGATAYIGGPGSFPVYDPSGSCVIANQPLPQIATSSGKLWDCRSSLQWINIGNGTMGNAGSTVRAFCTGTAGSAETEYLTGAACSGATTSTARYMVSAPGILADLQVVSSANFTGGTNKDVITVYKNGSATAVTCTNAGGSTTCSDTTHSVAVAAGDVLTFQFVSATSDTAANVSASVQIY